MRMGLHNRKDYIMLQRDYFIDETNNGWVNGVPAGIANKQMNDYIMQQQINQLLQQQGYQKPNNIFQALQMMFNNGRLRQPQQPRQQYFPNAMGF